MSTHNSRGCEPLFEWGRKVKKIVVDFDDFLIEARDSEVLVRAMADFSFGRAGHLTSRNATTLSNQREKVHISSKYPPPNGGAKMPYSLFFGDGSGCAFHQGDTCSTSHGCIHLNMDDASWLYYWAGSESVGLLVKGDYPQLPVSAKVYLMGGGNMSTFVIRRIQSSLFEAGYNAISTGIFDQQTDTEVRAFQDQNGLVADGRVGEKTFSKLGIEL
jgi:Putative peptidoglycan binding domain/L,D-transpeptidase catalytic domain